MFLTYNTLVFVFQISEPLFHSLGKTHLSNLSGETPGGTLNVEVIGMLVGNFFGEP